MTVVASLTSPDLSQLVNSTTPGVPPGPPSSAVTDPAKPISADLECQLQDFDQFLQTAPSQLGPTDTLVRHKLPTGDQVACIRWKERFYITSTDIIRGLVFRFLAVGRPVRKMKKFEEGVFSDLRNLKSGVDASLEEPRSEFLELLYKNQCIRTQKKQRVFHWYAVKHDYLFREALERDLKRESRGALPTTGGSHLMPPTPVAPTPAPPSPVLGVAQGQADNSPHHTLLRRALFSMTTSNANLGTNHFLVTTPTGPKSLKPQPEYYQHIAANGLSTWVPLDKPSHDGHDEDDNDILSELEAVNSELKRSEPTMSLCFDPSPGLSVPSPLVQGAEGGHGTKARAHPTLSTHLAFDEVSKHEADNKAEAKEAPPTCPVLCPIHLSKFSSGCVLCCLVENTLSKQTPQALDAVPNLPISGDSCPLPQGENTVKKADENIQSRARLICPHRCGRSFTHPDRLRRHIHDHHRRPPTLHQKQPLAQSASGTPSDKPAKMTSLARKHPPPPPLSLNTLPLGPATPSQSTPTLQSQVVHGNGGGLSSGIMSSSSFSPSHLSVTEHGPPSLSSPTVLLSPHVGMTGFTSTHARSGATYQPTILSPSLSSPASVVNGNSALNLHPGWIARESPFIYLPTGYNPHQVAATSVPYLSPSNTIMGTTALVTNGVFSSGNHPHFFPDMSQFMGGFTDNSASYPDRWDQLPDLIADEVEADSSEHASTRSSHPHPPSQDVGGLSS
ncbi:hypothetical protein IWQ62_004627 [Dispira parvispora]|uniref:C2H2-type domain-containing protein n=1 Tax=Dispira parvispora TaxID=1520584 RepID=A0A9W8E5Z4_9FUNG|nr:hypothetical protein IWQ62_004627 [Dispira parvispora]